MDSRATTFEVAREQMNETDPEGGERARKAATEAMIWTRVFYGREVMERILETIQVKHALRQRFLVRYTSRAAMAGVIICLLYIFSYQIKTDLGPGFNLALSKYLTAASF